MVVPYLTSLSTQILGVSPDLLNEVTVNEVNLTESLLTPGLQTSIIVQSTLNTEKSSNYSGPTKNLDEYYGKTLNVYVARPIIQSFNSEIKWNFSTSQMIYRLSNRKRTNYQIEQFQLDACDASLIGDAKTYVSKSWKATPPNAVVQDILSNCFSNISADIEPANPPRDYIATNIHPFQVISQQGDVALVQDNVIDPSFVHFMTYQNLHHQDSPTHNFRSLTTMAQQTPAWEFIYSGKTSTDENYANPQDIMDYSFPCDFDLLSDVLNGLDNTTGNSFLQINLFNPLKNNLSVYGPQNATNENGIAPWLAMSNLGTESIQNSNNIGAEAYQLLRRARMALLDQDKVALRITVPFSPFLNVGRTLSVKFYNTKTGDFNYGTGIYLIASMTHNIKLGGLGTTTIDCVANTVAVGRV